MESFSFYLKNERTRNYDRIAVFFLLINIIAFLYLAIATGPGTTRNKSIWGLIIISACFILSYFLRRFKKKHDTPYRELVSWGIAIACINMGAWLAASINILLESFYLLSKREMKVTVDKQGIYYPSFPVKKIGWEELSGVILKDGLLTIDLKNNRLIQQAVDETAPTVDEKLFNKYCEGKLISKIQ